MLAVDRLRALTATGRARAAVARDRFAPSVAARVLAECEKAAVRGAYRLVYHVCQEALNEHGAPLLDDVCALLRAEGIAVRHEAGSIWAEWHELVTP